MPDPASPSASIPHRLGGRWALSRAGFLITSVGIVLSIFVGEQSATRSGGEAVRWLAVALVGVLAYGLLLLALDRWSPYRDRRTTPVPLGVLALFTVATGVLVGTALGLGASLFGLETAQTVPVRVAGVVLIGSWFGLGLTLLLDEIGRSRRTRTRLIERQVSAELAALQQSLLIEELRSELRGEVDAQLRVAHEELDRRLRELAEAPSVPLAADDPVVLRTLAEETVRPLSAQLWSTAARRYPRVEWSKVVVNTVRHEPLRPVPLALIHILGTGLQTIQRFGTLPGLLLLAMTVLAIFAVCLPANVLMRRRPAWHGRIFVAAVVVLEAQIVPLVLWRESLVAGSATPAWAVTQVIAGVILILLTSGFGSWRQQRLAVERSYLQDLDRELITTMARSRAVADLARELSRTLHGTVQSKIVACAMLSEQAIESGDVEQLRAALEQAQRVLVASPEAEIRRGIDAEVRRKIALWDELCGFELVLGEDVEAVAAEAPTLSRTVGRVVEEGIANAIRHGGATEIRIELATVDAAAIRVVIEDNGRGVGTEVAPGLGSTFLDRAGDWSLTDAAEGARLEVVMATR